MDVPKNVLKGLRLVTVERMDQVLEAALLPEQARRPRLPTRRSRPAAPRSADQPVAPPSA